MKSAKIDVNKVATQSNGKGLFNMPKAVPAILLNILLERFSTTATSGKSSLK